MFPEPRPYQAEIIRAIMANGNTMVVLPTGTGKTLIAFYLMKKATKSLMMAPTKPLAEQHYKNFQPYSNSAVLITGEVPPKKRAELYKQSYIFATPQTVWNDITNGRIDLSSFDLIIFDECHRAVGDYAYAKIAREIHNAKIVGLTASPGSKKERIMEVVNNLSINSIELRTEEDLKDYLAAKSFKRVYVSLPPEMLLIRSLLRNLFDEFKARMKKYGIPVPMRKADLIRMGNRIMSLKSASKFTLIPIYVSLLNLQHSLELLETQGINAFLNYATNLVKEGKPSVRSLVTHRDFIRAMREARKALEKGVIHPKMAKLLDLIRTFKGKQIIVFVQYTDQINIILSYLEKHGIRARPFMGKKHGFDKKKQRATMEEFRAANFDVLVSSSIGEEGIDVPSVDAVIFYEPVPSEIRSIQRKGRTGRVRAGEVIVMITRGTRDEGYFYASSRREGHMKRVIEEIKKDLPPYKKPAKRGDHRITDWLP